jgi:hypothetical protein
MMANNEHGLFVIATRLALPERATKVLLRSYVSATWVTAPHLIADTASKPAAGVAAAGMVNRNVDLVP